MNTLLASILDCISPVAKSASLVTVAVTRNVATTKFPLPHPPLPPFHLIPNSAPQTSCTFPSSRIPTSSSSLRHLQLGIVFLDREPHAPHVFGDRFSTYVLLHRKSNGVKYTRYYSSRVSSTVEVCAGSYIDSRCSSRVRNRFNRSLRQSLPSKFNLYYLASAKVLVAIGVADESHPYGTRS